MTLGQNITALRKKSKLSQNDLGKAVGTSGDIIGRYERDEVKPSIEVAIKIADALVTLTPKEFELLYFLLKHPKQTFSREKLLTNIWGYDFEGDERTVDATIKRLRQKLLHPHYHYIQTSRGFGYKFEVLKHD